MFPSFSLDQLTTFVAVVEEGSFSAAGRRLGRVPSAVSYTIAQLEEALACSLFDRSGHRPRLTLEGQRLIAEARLVLAQAQELAACASLLTQLEPTQLCVLIDASYPPQRLAEVCAAFHRCFPTILLRVEIGLRAEILDAVRSGRGSLGVSLLDDLETPRLVAWHVGTVHLLPVCAPGHPLAQRPAPHSNALLQRYLQIVHADRGGSAEKDRGVLASRTWRVTDQRLKHALILDGVGWGSLPRRLIQADLDAERLVRLRPSAWPPTGHSLELHVVAREDHLLGHAEEWLRDQLVFSPLSAEPGAGTG